MSTPAPVVARLRAAGCVWAEDEAAILVETAGGAGEALESLLARRVRGEPLEQVVGWAAFLGLRVHVRPRVFVPRRRTEVLARTVIALVTARTAGPALGAAGGAADGAAGGDRAPQVLDLCCGAGAIGAAVAAAVPSARIWASDVDQTAVACARVNLPDADVVVGDLFAGLPSTLRGTLDVIALNAPYVPTADLATMPGEARLHEPPHTLDGGQDGLALHRLALAEAGDWLAPGGALATECADTQVEALTAVVLAAGLDAEWTWDDDLEVAVVTGVRRS